MAYRRSFKRPFVLYRNPEEERKNAWIRHICYRVLKQERNFLCAVTGGTGSGKSYACVKIGEEYSKVSGISFDPERDYFFYFKDLIESITDPEIEKQIPYGRFIVYDEMQAEANSRDFQSKMNKRINRLLSIFRAKRHVLLFPTPMFQALDSQARHLLHAEFMVEGFDSNHNTSSILPRALIGWNRLKDEPYRYKLMVKYKIPNKSKHGVGLVGQWKLPMASKETLEPYLIKKKKYLHDEITEMASEVKKENNRQVKEEKVINFKEFADYYDVVGEDYIKLTEKFPQFSVTALERMANLHKRATKYTPRRSP